ncbi:MAG TPA: cyclase family protein, partial [Gemmataceae bacterium]|nr:cyclase family protein [Gemmataceae bacterium]
LVLGIVLAAQSWTFSQPPPKQQSLLDIYAILKTKRFVDLTHAFGPGIPHWPGFPDEKRETLYYYDEGVGSQGSGFFAQRYTIVGQWGTHVDPPAHFAKGLRTVDEIDVKEMLLPLVVLDVHDAAAKNADYILTMKDVEQWEKKHGAIPEGAFVAMRTDWAKRWPDAAKMRNGDDKKVAHYPGWSMEVLQYLYEKRKITASGHETTDTDPGVAASKGDFALETYILKTNHYQIELLANLDQVPEFGALVVVSFPKPKKGSGFPARVFAILP